MNLLTISLAHLRHQKLASALHLLLLSLGVAMIAALLLLAAQVGGRLERDAEGIDAVIGAKGSPLQLILSSVYHLDIPTGNIPLEEAQRWMRNSMVGETWPISLGDNARGFRIVGTTPALPVHYGATLVSGRIWKASMEAVIGSDVAAAGLHLNQQFVGIHGLGASGHVHAESPYRVVGVLAPTGTVADRLIFTSLESVWDVHAAHHHHHEVTTGAVADHGDTDHDKDHDEDHDHDADPTAPREITALLIHYRTPLAAVGFTRTVNTTSNLQAASPAFETERLLQLLGLGLDTLRALAAVLVVAAGLSVFVTLYNAMEARQYDLAVLRSLGASRASVVRVLWFEALILSLFGTVLGLLIGHLAITALGHYAGSAKGVGLTGLTWTGEEFWLLLLPLLIGTLAAWLPALRAYRSDVAAVLSRG